MTQKEISDLADKYIEMEEAEQKFRIEKKKQIIEIAGLIVSSRRKDIYKELYRENCIIMPGGFEAFKDAIMKELKEREKTS